ncbi:glycosyltransferase family 32 protein [Chaetomium fimeti]|uniref:Glycosyltransferase family 32 protein n=1 Tax=Chaetomium fimeti TaxID=1854472 RepID=A0AAE0HDL0_9PEZI|nr:glycosyltransferase family 32 protein [Chaetomium fimeti]
MAQQNELVASSSWPAQFLHYVSRRRQRFYGVIAVALVMLAAATFIYGGFATGIDFGSYVPRPKAALPPAHNDGAAGTVVPTGAHGGDAVQTQIPTAPVTQTQTQTGDDAGHPAQTQTQTPPVAVQPGIPAKIWQILLPKSSSKSKESFVADPQILSDTPTWLAMNTDYVYTLVGQKGGDEFVRKHFGTDQRIVDAYTGMPNVGMKSDLLRYLILSAEGGVYTDTDTVALRPIDEWVPEGVRDKAAVVVGIEWDRRDGPGWTDISHWVQFCQWTIAAAPGHPVFGKMVERILASLDDLAAAHGVPFGQLAKLDSFEVMNSTGPAAWTDVVFAQLQEYDPSLTDTKDLSYMDEPKLIGDILVLSIDGFGMGQPHSKSTNDGTVPEDALVRHLFKGAWRGDKRKRRI